MSEAEIRESPRFLTDRMLGKLATYLLMLGYDTLFFAGGERSHLVMLAKEQSRVLLSRDTRLARLSDLPEFLFIDDDIAIHQVRQVVRHFGLPLQAEQWFTRCLRCNLVLRRATPEEVKDRAPAYIVSTHLDFSVCLECGRVYWKGTHQRRMEKMLKSVFGVNSEQ